MDSDELIKYMNDNQLEYQMLSLLLFYSVEFMFLPINNPILIKENDYISLLGGDGYNMFSTDYQSPGFYDQLSNAPGGMRFFNHPEYLKAIQLRFGCEKFTICHYSRKSSAIKDIRELAFSNFIFIFHVDDIITLNKCISKAEENRKNWSRYYSPYIDRNVTDVNLLFDDSIYESIENNSIDFDIFYQQVKNRLKEIDEKMTDGLYVSCDSYVEFASDDSQKIVSLYCTQNYTPLPNIKTTLNKESTLISEEDTISDILYSLAIKLNANKLLIATGYAYESGLHMLEPTMELVKNHDNANVEIIVGALQNYDGINKTKELNIKTANKINDLIQNMCISTLMTRRDCFYHGKFYYISNGNESYIICGSSNVTSSAYEKNDELDLLFKFDDTTNRYLERKLLERYNHLKEHCDIIQTLNQNCFDKNFYVDESGKSKVDNIYKKLTNDEEVQRFNYLKKHSPDEIFESPFIKGIEFGSFKNYSLFIFERIHISILEGFSYGDACYIFEANDIEEIKKIISMKSKNEVKRDERFLTSVIHDEHYTEKINQIIEKRN